MINPRNLLNMICTEAFEQNALGMLEGKREVGLTHQTTHDAMLKYWYNHDSGKLFHIKSRPGEDTHHIDYAQENPHHLNLQAFQLADIESRKRNAHGSPTTPPQSVLQNNTRLTVFPYSKVVEMDHGESSSRHLRHAQDIITKMQIPMGWDVNHTFGNSSRIVMSTATDTLAAKSFRDLDQRFESLEIPASLFESDHSDLALRAHEFHQEFAKRADVANVSSHLTPPTRHVQHAPGGSANIGGDYVESHRKRGEFDFTIGHRLSKDGQVHPTVVFHHFYADDRHPRLKGGMSSLLDDYITGAKKLGVTHALVIGGTKFWQHPARKHSDLSWWGYNEQPATDDDIKLSNHRNYVECLFELHVDPLIRNLEKPIPDCPKCKGPSVFVRSTNWPNLRIDSYECTKCGQSHSQGFNIKNNPGHVDEGKTRIRYSSDKELRPYRDFHVDKDLPDHHLDRLNSYPHGRVFSSCSGHRTIATEVPARVTSTWMGQGTRRPDLPIPDKMNKVWAQPHFGITNLPSTDFAKSLADHLRSSDTNSEHYLMGKDPNRPSVIVHSKIPYEGGHQEEWWTRTLDRLFSHKLEESLDETSTRYTEYGWLSPDGDHLVGDGSTTHYTQLKNVGLSIEDANRKGMVRWWHDHFGNAAYTIPFGPRHRESVSLAANHVRASRVPGMVSTDLVKTDNHMDVRHAHDHESWQHAHGYLRRILDRGQYESLTSVVSQGSQGLASGQSDASEVVPEAQDTGIQALLSECDAILEGGSLKGDILWVDHPTMGFLHTRGDFKHHGDWYEHLGIPNKGEAFDRIPRGRVSEWPDAYEFWHHSGHGLSRTNYDRLNRAYKFRQNRSHVEFSNYNPRSDDKYVERSLEFTDGTKWEKNKNENLSEGRRIGNHVFSGWWFNHKHKQLHDISDDAGGGTNDHVGYVWATGGWEGAGKVDYSRGEKLGLQRHHVDALMRGYGLDKSEDDPHFFQGDWGQEASEAANELLRHNTRVTHYDTGGKHSLGIQTLGDHRKGLRRAQEALTHLHQAGHSFPMDASVSWEHSADLESEDPHSRPFFKDTTVGGILHARHPNDLKEAYDLSDYEDHFGLIDPSGKEHWGEATRDRMHDDLSRRLGHQHTDDALGKGWIRFYRNYDEVGLEYEDGHDGIHQRAANFMRQYQERPAHVDVRIPGTSHFKKSKAFDFGTDAVRALRQWHHQGLRESNSGSKTLKELATRVEAFDASDLEALYGRDFPHPTGSTLPIHQTLTKHGWAHDPTYTPDQHQSRYRKGGQEMYVSMWYGKGETPQDTLAGNYKKIHTSPLWVHRGGGHGQGAPDLDSYLTHIRGARRNEAKFGREVLDRAGWKFAAHVGHVEHFSHPDWPGHTISLHNEPRETWVKHKTPKQEWALFNVQSLSGHLAGSRTGVWDEVENS